MDKPRERTLHEWGELPVRYLHAEDVEREREELLDLLERAWSEYLSVLRVPLTYEIETALKRQGRLS